MNQINTFFRWFFLMACAYWAAHDPCYAQKDALSFVHYTMRQGLGNHDVRKVAQDQDGFLWVANSSGLDRFNGYAFEDFSFLFGENKGLQVLDLLCDKQGNIWIGTNRGGIFVYHPRTHTLRQYPPDPADPNSINNAYVNKIFEADDGTIWIGTWYGLSRYDPQMDGFVAYPFPVDLAQQVYNYAVIETIAEADNGWLWLGCWGSGLHVFHPATQQFRHIDLASKAPNSSSPWVRDLAFGPDGSLWIATVGKGLFQLHTDSGNLVAHAPRFAGYPADFNRQLSLYWRDPSELWIGTDGGLIRFLPATGQVFHTGVGKGSSFLLEYPVQDIFEDNHRGIWIAAGGLNYFNHAANQFDQFADLRLQDSDSGNEAYCFFEPTPGQIWISTSEGIVQLDAKTRQAPLQRLFPEPIYQFGQLPNGQIVAATARNGAYLYDPERRTIQHWKASNDLANGLLQPQILAMLVDWQGNVWMGNHDGLSCRRAADGKFIHFAPQPAYAKGLISRSVNQLYMSAEGTLWVANGAQLLKMTHLEGKLLQAGGPSGLVQDSSRYAFETVYHGAVATRAIVELKGQLWITDNSLLQLDMRTGKVLRGFSQADGLASNQIRSIVPDGQHNLWITTDNGLSHLQTDAGRFRNFYQEDGLQGDHFSRCPAFRSSSGQIFVGSSHGFNAFDPQKISPNPYRPPVFITKFLVFNEPLPARLPSAPDTLQGLHLPKQVSYVQQIELNHDQNVFTVEFAALNFLYPRQNQFAYQLEEVDKEWNYVNNRRYASYSNIPEGKWLVFKVKASNNNGVWGDQEAVLRIYVHPPFWDTWWFRGMVGALVALLVGGVAYWRIRQLKSQKLELERMVRARTIEVEQQKMEIETQNEELMAQSAMLLEQKEQLEELDRSKNRFYTHISHEFRTPLSLILGPSEELMKDETLTVKAKHYLRLVHQSADRLLRLVVQIMDLAKLSEGKLRLEVAAGDVVELLNNVAQSLHFSATEKQISYSVHCNPNKAIGYFDRDKLEKIAVNLIQNAIKYTPDGQSVQVVIEVDKSNTALTFQVIDSGIGIAAQDQERIFDAYYRVEKGEGWKTEGTGIGLSLVKGLVELHKGRIGVESKLGVGTVFSVVLPLSSEYYTPEEMVQHRPSSTLGTIGVLPALPETLLPSGEAKSRVLIVEDNPALGSFLRNILWEHFEVEEAANGAEAWERIPLFRPDLVVSDLAMPKMDGLELCRKIKASPETASIPVVLLTAHTSLDTQLNTLQSGADDFLPKPVNAELLQLKIANLIRSRQQAKQQIKAQLQTEPDILTQDEADRQFMRKIMRILEENVANRDLNIEFFADQLHMSRTQLYEKVTRASGNSLNTIIKNFRLKYAEKLLLETRINTSELAYAVGFSDPKYFSKCFKKMYNMTPKDYRQSKIR